MPREKRRRTNRPKAARRGRIDSLKRNFCGPRTCEFDAISSRLDSGKLSTVVRCRLQRRPAHQGGTRRDRRDGAPQRASQDECRGACGLTDSDRCRSSRCRMAPVDQLHDLKFLSLERTAIGDAGVAHLAKLNEFAVVEPGGDQSDGRGAGAPGRIVVPGKPRSQGIGDYGSRPGRVGSRHKSETRLREQRGTDIGGDRRSGTGEPAFARHPAVSGRQGSCSRVHPHL